MPKQRIEIELEVPDGYEATGELLEFGKKLPVWDHCIHAAVLIRRVPSVRDWWPKWLLAPWIGIDDNGDAWAFDDEPDKVKTRFQVADVSGGTCEPLQPWMIHLDIPADLRGQKIRNPWLEPYGMAGPPYDVH